MIYFILSRKQYLNVFNNKMIYYSTTDRKPKRVTTTAEIITFKITMKNIFRCLYMTTKHKLLILSRIKLIIKTNTKKFTSYLLSKHPHTKYIPTAKSSSRFQNT